MALTYAQRNRMIRKEALREQLSVQCHYQHFTDAVEKMAELAEGSIDQDAKDRFAMYNAIADKHWKVVSKYMLPTEAEPDERAVAEIRRIIVQPVISAEQALETLS